MLPRTVRIARELQFQQAQAELVSDIGPTPADIIVRYRRLRHWRIWPKEYMYHAMGDLTGRRVLDFGCGSGEITTQLALLGAEQVTGFDLSPDLVAIAERRAQLDGVADRVQFLVADGENVDLPKASFDFVVVYALLHHTELGPVLDRVLDALTPDGTAFFVEPVAFSPLLQALRDRVPVPKVVSPDERQLTLEEIREVQARFRSSRIVYFNVLGRLQRLLIGRPGHSRVAWWMACGFHYVDRILLRVPGFWRTAGIVLIAAKK